MRLARHPTPRQESRRPLRRVRRHPQRCQRQRRIAFDLFIGAPGAWGRGEAYLFYGPFEIPPGQTELIIDADDADVIFTSFFDDDEDFGRRVAPLNDLTGNGRPELRVYSSYTDADGWQYNVTQVFAGMSNTRLFIAIHDPCNVNPWAILDGDVFGDQAVTNIDLAHGPSIPPILRV